ncbi:MAG: AAA family ATPase, partial [Clostridia bacterium]|nr:AAA family ATPase [Clostridia bacterium]
GPLGTGKTMLAKAMANESDVTFISTEGNAFHKSYVGEGKDAVHDLFRTARKYAPSIVFVDEIEAIAMERGSESASSGIEATTTAFLTEMDGFKNDPNKPVFVLAATNFDADGNSARKLDAAFMRRFDRRIYIDLPNREEREKYIRKQIKKRPLLQISDTKIESIVTRSTGMSLAQLESVIELALRMAIRDGDLKVTDSVFDEAFETFNGGESKKWNSDVLMRVARHEAGHAFICWRGGETPSYVTIVARADHGGYMRHDDAEDKPILTRAEVANLIRTSLGGRAAEIAYYGEEDGVSTGASSDLQSATYYALRMLCSYGMDKKHGLASVPIQTYLQNGMPDNILAAVNEILARELQEAIDIINEGKPYIDKLVDHLLAKDHISGAELNSLFDSVKQES